MINKSLYIDRIRGTENLTDELVDSDARWLFDWGIGKLTWFSKGSPMRRMRMNGSLALMACMRKINRFMSQLQKKDEGKLWSPILENLLLFLHGYRTNRSTRIP